MALYVKETLENIKRQIVDHRKTEAKQYIMTPQDRRLQILDKNNPMNFTFPWLCAAFVKELVGGDVDDSVIPPGILSVVYIYKIMEQLFTGKGFRTFLGVMRRNDLWCTIRTYGFGELKNTSYLAHQEAKVLSMISGNRFFDNFITGFKTLVGFYIVTGHVKSTPLHNFIKCQERFNDKELRFYAEELVCAIEFLHSKGIIHRDLTAANIKLTAEGHIKVFNLHNAYLALDENGKVEADPQAEGVVGQDAYLAPEMIDLQLHGYAVDWWCLGIVLYFMMTGKLPFRGETKRELYLNIKYRTPLYEEGLHEPLTHDLIRSFLVKKQKNRLGSVGTSEVFRHMYFRTTDWHKVLNGGSPPPFLPATSAVTSLPSAMCVSYEHLGDSEPVKKAVSRRDVERIQTQSLNPDEFYEFELRHDWTTYVHPDMPFEEAVHYMHGELKPPMQADEGIPLEECITKVPELSDEEKQVFMQFIGNPKYEPEYVEQVKLEDNSFMVMNADGVRRYQQGPAEFLSNIVLDASGSEDDSSIKLGTPTANSHDFSFSRSSRSEGMTHDNFLKPADAEDGATASNSYARVKDSFKLMDKVKFWKHANTKAFFKKSD